MTGVDLRGLPLSEKQIEYVCESNFFVNLAEGAIRSGKTASGLLRWLMYLADPKTPKERDLVVTAKTYDTAVRNIFNPLRDPVLFGPLAKATTYTRGADRHDPRHHGRGHHLQRRTQREPAPGHDLPGRVRRRVVPDAPQLP
ncbi:hypothetical protein GA0074692_6812 [Micromonospora pallida]|uniref:Terminase-like family protein n=1 Tax=Micromonospora pallida TaxID=145854 RepID=A0A1C6TNG4_9ACTN|nr:hypothetical protein [Micromonospora pallida]SCL43306.1 hypothetical protein GA0074692_6812 [Micromonospora pallida]